MALMALNVLVAKYLILVAIAFMAVLAGQLQNAVAIRPDPPSNPDSQITGSLKLPAARSGLIVEVLDHQFYTDDDDSLAQGLDINADGTSNAQQRLTNKYPSPSAAKAPRQPKFHAQGLINAYPPPPPGNPTHGP